MGIPVGNLADVYDVEVVVKNIQAPVAIGNDWRCRSSATLHKRGVSNNSTGGTTYNFGTGGNYTELRAHIVIQVDTPGSVAWVKIVDYSVVLKKAAG